MRSFPSQQHFCYWRLCHSQSRLGPFVTKGRQNSHTRLLGSAHLTLPGSGCCLCASPPVCVLTSLSLYLCLYLCLCLLYLWLFLCVFLSVFMALGMKPRTLCNQTNIAILTYAHVLFPFLSLSVCILVSLSISLHLSLFLSLFLFLSLRLSIFSLSPSFCVSVSWSLSLSPPPSPLPVCLLLSLSSFVYLLSDFWRCSPIGVHHMLDHRWGPCLRSLDSSSGAWLTAGWLLHPHPTPRAMGQEEGCDKSREHHMSSS